MDAVAEAHPPVEVTLRKATPDDQAIIRALVREAELDPSSLHWSHFIVAELPGDVPSDQRIIGIGQIRPYRNCPELGSLYVKKPYRRHGIASQIMQALLTSRPAPIYLECADHNIAFYKRFGFYEIPWHRAPWPLSLKSGAGALAARLGLLSGHRVAAMRWDGVQ